MHDLALAEVHDLMAAALAAEPVRDSAPPNLPAPRGPARVDWEAEHAVLGALLYEGLDDRRAAWVACSRLLTAADFFDPVHAEVWRAMTALYEARRDVDVITLCAQLRSVDRINTVGGAQYIGALTDELITTAHVVSWASIVAEESAARKLGTALKEELHKLARGERTASVRERVMTRARAVQVSTVAPTPRLGEDAIAWTEELERRLNGEEEAALSTGLTDLDDALGGGLRPGFVVLGARPRVGKTALALQVSLRLANAGRPVYMLSLEMTRRQLWRATVACVGEVSLTHLLNPKLLSAADEARWVAAANRAHGWPIYIDAVPSKEELDRAKAQGRPPPPTPPRTLAGIACAIGALPVTPGLIVLDHIGKLETAKRHSDERAKYKELSQEIHELGVTLGIPILTLAHLKRLAPDRHGVCPRPTMESLGEASFIEAAADAVAILHREDLYPSRRYDDNDPAPKGQVDVLIAKVRDAEPNRVARLYFDGERQRFHSTKQRDEGVASDRPGPVAAGADSLDAYGAGDGLPDVDVPAAQRSFDDLGPQDAEGA